MSGMWGQLEGVCVGVAIAPLPLRVKVEQTALNILPQYLAFLHFIYIYTPLT